MLYSCFIISILIKYLICHLFLFILFLLDFFIFTIVSKYNDQYTCWYCFLFSEMIYPSELKLSFQLLLLFLTPPNRRQLHLLFRVINKILKNQKFILDVQIPMRYYVSYNFSLIFIHVKMYSDYIWLLFEFPHNLDMSLNKSMF